MFCCQICNFVSADGLWCIFIPICCLGSSSGVGSGSDGWSDGEGVGMMGSGQLWFDMGGDVWH